MKTTLSRAQRAFISVSIDIGISAIAWLAIVEHTPWAENLFSFVTAIISAIGLIVFSKEACSECAKAGHALPSWISLGFDLSIAFCCAAAGIFWLATAWLWIALSSAVLFKKQ